jgi:hypothetical protein
VDDGDERQQEPGAVPLADLEGLVGEPGRLHHPLGRCLADLVPTEEEGDADRDADRGPRVGEAPVVDGRGDELAEPVATVVAERAGAADQPAVGVDRHEQADDGVRQRRADRLIG